MQNATNGKIAKFIAKECIHFYHSVISLHRFLRICPSAATISPAMNQTCNYLGTGCYGISYELYNFYNSQVVCVLFRSMWTLIDEACMGGFVSKQRVAIVSL